MHRPTGKLTVMTPPLLGLCYSTHSGISQGARYVRRCESHSILCLAAPSARTSRKMRMRVIARCPQLRYWKCLPSRALVRCLLELARHAFADGGDEERCDCAVEVHAHTRERGRTIRELGEEGVEEGWVCDEGQGVAQKVKQAAHMEGSEGCQEDV